MGLAAERLARKPETRVVTPPSPCSRCRFCWHSAAWAGSPQIQTWVPKNEESACTATVSRSGRGGRAGARHPGPRLYLVSPATLEFSIADRRRGVMGKAIASPQRRLFVSTHKGIAKAKAAGVYKGRPTSIDPAQGQRLKAEGWGPSQIARKLGISRASIYRALEGH